MSSSCRPKPGSLQVHVHKLLPRPEAAQRANSLTCSPHQLGPHSLTPHTLHHEDTERPPNLGRTPNCPKMPNRAKDKEKKESLVKSVVSEWRQARVTDGSSRGGAGITPPKMVHCSSDSVQIGVRAPPRKTHDHSSHHHQGKQQPPSSLSDRGGAENDGQLRTKQWCGREIWAKEKLWVGRNVAETHERKLQKELKKLSVQNWPSRDRLVVFSDVFDDTEYDFYLNHLLDSQSPLPDKVSLEDLGRIKEMEMELVDAEEEVLGLEEEARRALLDNKRVRSELRGVPALTDPGDSDTQSESPDLNRRIKDHIMKLRDGGTSLCHRDGVQVKRIQVLDTWREIQQLEEEIRDKLVSTDTTTATETHIRRLQTERVRLIASNHRLRASNEKLEDRVKAVLDREKASKAIRRALWDGIHSDLRTKRE